jgi:hypothetical protein
MLIVFAMIFITVNLYEFFKPKEIIKIAIDKSELNKKNYILCQPCSVTGSEWRLVGGSDIIKSPEYCIVNGADPEGELNLKYEFMTAGNTYIFYVLEEKVYYSETLGEQCKEYTVEGWDILYPAKHGVIFDGITFSKYITSDDTIR